jgi:hypothetical protein
VSSASIKKFFWQNIICRYGIPRHITVDNAKYFDNAMFSDFSKQIGMKVVFASVYHPQSNGAVEAIKKILEGEKKGKWQRPCQPQCGATTPQCAEQQISHLFG